MRLLTLTNTNLALCVPCCCSIAFLNFGLVSTGKLQLASGILLAIDGGLMLLLTFRYPSLFAANTASDSGAAPAKGPGQV